MADTAEHVHLELRIDARIDAHYGKLPPQERRVADFLLEHLGDLAIFSAADISRETGVSKATVSRLFRKLDFEDFKEVRDHARTLRSRGLPTAAPLLSADREDESGEFSTGVDRHCAREQQNLTSLARILAEGRLGSAVQLLAQAQRVTIIGLRNSYPVALHLHQQLLQARTQVRLAPQPGQTLGEELAGLREGDVVVTLGFRRRPSVFARVIERVAASDAALLCIGDSTSRHYAGQSQLWLECPVDAEGAFDSYAAPMSLMSLLANGVFNSGVQDSRRRVSAIAAAYDDLAELET